ncbi:type 1 periplasmic-binding domain-containing protein [Streptomyces kebangsaanensis]|uniref:LacI family transcriptional regulator n=1 Tax=Streptomyces kebangsaanensis TaxID=864058 RepID=UPI001161379D|nr:LacI family transcriptional regulator [Streptomyces kebangsaanensis]
MLSRRLPPAGAVRSALLQRGDRTGLGRSRLPDIGVEGIRTLDALVHDLANAFFAVPVTGVEQAAREADLGMMVCFGAPDPAKAARRPALLTSYQVGSVILTSGEGVGRTVTVFRRNVVPLVVAGQPSARRLFGRHHRCRRVHAALGTWMAIAS